jgi:hypothetical protein
LKNIIKDKITKEANHKLQQDKSLPIDAVLIELTSKAMMMKLKIEQRMKKMMVTACIGVP